MSVAIGIDLGTTNTAIAVVAEGTVTTLEDDHGRRLLPSVVSFHPQGSVLVGELARDRRTVDPKNTVYSVKRLIGRPFSSPEVQRSRAHLAFELAAGPKDSTTVLARGTTYAVPEISAFVLRRAKAIAEAALNVTVDRAVITVPASFNELQRASTKVAGRLAGLDVLRIINEPTAAALAYGQLLKDSKRIVVYDFGGGTFDVTILDLSGPVFEVLSTAGDTMLGGDDIDTRLAEILADQCLRQTGFDGRADPMALAQLRMAAEEMKRQLSDATVLRRKIGDVGFGQGGRAIEFDADLTRAQLESLARPYVQRTLDVTKQALETVGMGLKEIDEVLLVGGSTRMPLVASMVTAFFGKPASLRVNPDEVVALGAGVQAHALHKPKVQISLPKPKPRRSAVATQPPTFLNPAAAPRANNLPIIGADSKSPDAAPAGQFGAVAELGAGLPVVDAVLHAQPVGVAGAAAAAIAAATVEPDSEQARGARAAGKPVVQLRKTEGDPTKPVHLASSGKMPVAAPVAPPVAPPVVAPAPPPAPAAKAPLRRRDPREDTNPPPRVEYTQQQPVLFELNKSAAAWSDSDMPPALPASTGKGAALGRVALGTIAQLKSTAAIPAVRPPVATMFGLGESEAELEPPSSPAPAVVPAVAPAALPIADVAPAASTQAVQVSEMAPAALPVAAPEYLQAAANASAPMIIDLQREDEELRSIPTRARAALLVDVTPLSLRVETVGGYSDALIARNTPVPSERTRVFLTAQDGQTRVTVRVAQGEQARFADNTFLGELELTGILPAPRGDTKIAVTFALDADGTLQVRAQDAKTKAETRATMRLLGATDDAADMAAMLARQQAREVVG